MGWTSYTVDNLAKTDAILRREFTQDSANNTRSSWTVEDSATVGAQWYALMKHTDTKGQETYYGLVCLTERRNGWKNTVEFCFKDMDETCHPYYYDCPARILDKLDRLAPNPSPNAAAWRAKCRERLATKSAKAKARRQEKQAARERLARFISDHFQVIHIGA